ncbi:MAG: adenylate kinase [Rhodospirillum sp.]|nr:adenylate kinase [Rhodospirillum sp.]
MVHIHITGASGSGTTSLGRALAEEMSVLHLDADDLFWLRTEPPYATPRNRDERIDLLLETARPEPSWILSGSALTWGAKVEALFDLIVFLRTDPQLRNDRLRQREMARYGARIQAGGDMVAKHKEFMDWAARYDTAGPEQRSLVAHEQWLVTQTCPVLRLDSSRPIADLVREIRRHPAMAGKT